VEGRLVSQLTLFDYSGQSIRTVMIDGEPWFVAADVCTVLTLSNIAMALTRLDEADISETDVWYGSYNRAYTLKIINEGGLYELVIRSGKAEAKAFRRWITHEVLPAIRKTGSYSVLQDRLMEIVDYRNLRDLVTGAVDYHPSDPATARAFGYMQNVFHIAVTGMSAKEISGSGREILTWTGKRGPTKADRKVAKNYLTSDELKKQDYLGRIVVGHLGLWTLSRTYTVRDFVELVTDVIEEKRELLGC
jgi:prophage antirepressor-like protein